MTNIMARGAIRIIWETRKKGTAVDAIQTNELSNLQPLIVDTEVQGYGSGGVLQHHQITIRIHQSDHAGQMKIASGKVIRAGEGPELRHVRHAMIGPRNPDAFVRSRQKIPGTAHEHAGR